MTGNKESTKHGLEGVTFVNLEHYRISFVTFTIQSGIILLIKEVSLMSSTVTVMTEVRLDKLLEFDVRLNTKLTPDLLSFNMRPS